LVIGASAAYASSMVVLNEVWYKQSPRQSFAFFNDSREWFQVDKVGHFYAAFQLSHMTARSLQWTGLSKRRSDSWGTATGFTVISSIEVFDGFSAAYGASVTDLIANAAGAAFYLGQQKLWNEIRLHPKFSFSRTDFAAQRPNVLGENLGQELIKDYNGQTYWLSFDADKFFPFPAWLNLAVGYGADGMIFANKQGNVAAGLDPHRQFYLGVDFDLTCIKTKSKILHALIFFLNMIKLPAPALEFSQGKVKMHALQF